MQTSQRPVPSRAAIKALRGIAYVASGTACGAAALVYEERRRRINFLRRVAENGRIIRNFADKRQSHAAAAAAFSDFDALHIDSTEAWTVNPARPARPRRASSALQPLEAHGQDYRSASWLEGAHDDILPSQVEKAYRQLELTTPPKVPKEAGDTMSDTCMHREKKRVFGGSSIGVPNTSGHAATRRFSEAMEPWARSLRGLQNGVNVDRELRVINFHLNKQQLSPRGRNLDRNLNVGPVDMLRLSVELGLNNVLGQTCIFLQQEGKLLSVLKDFSMSLLQSRMTIPTSALYKILQTLDEDRSKTLPETVAWVRYSLLVASRNDAILASIGSTFLSYSERTGMASALQRLERLTEMYVEAGDVNWAARVFTVTLRSLDDVGRCTTSVSQVCGLLRAAGQRQLSKEILIQLNLRKPDTIARLWESTEDPADLLDLFQIYGLQGLRDKNKLDALWEAICDQGETHLVVSELSGPRERLWTAATARMWQLIPDVKAVVRRFWQLQATLGERPMGAHLYKLVAQRLAEAQLGRDVSIVEATRKRLFSANSNVAVVADILQAAEASDWDAVNSRIRSLKVSGFANAPFKQRIQIFDPVFKAYTTASAADLFQLATDLYVHICGPLSQSIILRRLMETLTRLGRVDAMTKVYHYAKDELHLKADLTAVDAFQILRCYQHSFCPSHVVLADMVRKLHKGAWNLTSRALLPLLSMSASHDAKFGQMTDVMHRNRNSLLSAISLLDDEEHRSRIVERRLGNLQARGLLHHTAETNLDRPGQLAGSHFVRPGQDDAEGSARNDPGGHFAYWKTKSALFDATSNNDLTKIHSAIQMSESGGVHALSATMAASAVHLAGRVSREFKKAVERQLELADTDTSLIELCRLISILADPDVYRERLKEPAYVVEVKRVLAAEYVRIEEHGHATDHSLATAIANTMLHAQLPSLAIEVLRFVFSLPHAIYTPISPASMQVLLRAYIQVGNTTGIRWVISQMLANDVILRPGFSKPLDDGAQRWKENRHVSAATRAEICNELAISRKVVAARREQQIHRSWDVGNALVKFLIENAIQPKPSEREFSIKNHAWVDAVIVQKVARHISVTTRNHFKSLKRGRRGKPRVAESPRTESRDVADPLAVDELGDIVNSDQGGAADVGDDDHGMFADSNVDATVSQAERELDAFDLEEARCDSQQGTICPPERRWKKESVTTSGKCASDSRDTKGRSLLHGDVDQVGSGRRLDARSRHHLDTDKRFGRKRPRDGGAPGRRKPTRLGLDDGSSAEWPRLVYASP